MSDELTEAALRRLIDKMDRDRRIRADKIVRENDGRFGVGA